MLFVTHAWRGGELTVPFTGFTAEIEPIDRIQRRQAQHPANQSASLLIRSLQTQGDHDCRGLQHAMLRRLLRFGVQLNLLLSPDYS